MKIPILIVVMTGICFIAYPGAYACTYCPAIPSYAAPPQPGIPSIIWEVIVIGGVIGGWIVIFGLFRENTRK